jgi:hypothetical protein
MILLGPRIGFESNRLMRALSFISIVLFFTSMYRVALVLFTPVDVVMALLFPNGSGPHFIFF